MTTLAVDKPRDYELGDYNDLPVIANDIIYEGAVVGDNGSGYARPLTAGDPFRGFAVANVDNTGGSAGAKNVRVIKHGYAKLSVGSLAITDVGKPVYASDDDTFTLTASTNTPIGRVHRFISTGVGIVCFDAGRAGLGLLTAITDSSGGTANDATGVAAISASPTQAEVRNALATIIAKVNAILAQIK